MKKDFISKYESWVTFCKDLEELVSKLKLDGLSRSVVLLIGLETVLEDWNAERTKFFEYFEYAAHTTWEEFLRSKGELSDNEQSLEEFNQEQAPHKYIGY